MFFVIYYVGNPAPQNLISQKSTKTSKNKNPMFLFTVGVKLIFNYIISLPQQIPYQESYQDLQKCEA